MKGKKMKIDRKFPIPTSKGIGAPRKYPFLDMDVGDSVFFEGKKIPCKEYTAAQAAGSRTGVKFAARTVDGGLRIWRIE